MDRSRSAHRRPRRTRSDDVPTGTRASGFWKVNRAWIVGALAYGFSWPFLDGLNLSWLAWGAFVPLFVALSTVSRFRTHAALVLGFLSLATLINCWGWFFGVPPTYRWVTIAGGIVQIGLLSVPLLTLYWIKRWMTYGRSLWALVLLWPLWEWAAHRLPLSLNFLLLAQSQGANTWLIQYADLLGVWAISAWVIAFNVALYHAYTLSGNRVGKAMARAALRPVALLLLMPLAYASTRYVQLRPDSDSDAIRATLVSTDFPPMAYDTDAQMERVVHLTDSVAYTRRDVRPDLYVWSEGSMDASWTQPERTAFLYSAVDDWQAPLLTGTITQRWTTALISPTPADTVAAERVRLNQATLIHPDGDSARTLHTYDKIQLMPGQETFPGYAWLGGFESIQAIHRAQHFLTAGDAIRLLPLRRPGEADALLAAPICHEVNFPEHWAAMTRQGADAFVQLNFESWFGDWGFQRVLSGITRIRAIENRRSVARSANGGPSVFFDAFGSAHDHAPPEGVSTGQMELRQGRTLYVRAPWLTPLFCLLGLIGLIAFRKR